MIRKLPQPEISLLVVYPNSDNPANAIAVTKKVWVIEWPVYRINIELSDRPISVAKIKKNSYAPAAEAFRITDPIPRNSTAKGANMITYFSEVP